MEPDSIQHDKLESEFTEKYRLDMLNPGNLLQSTWIRRTFCNSNEVDWIFLGYGLNFLLPVSIILWLLFFIT
jgi:hypothetical protein